MGHWVMSVYPKNREIATKAPLFFLRLRRFRPGPPAFFQIHPAVRRKGNLLHFQQKAMGLLAKRRECAGQPTGPVTTRGRARRCPGRHSERAPHHSGHPGIAQQAGNLPVSRYPRPGGISLTRQYTWVYSGLRLWLPKPSHQTIQGFSFFLPQGIACLGISYADD